jgi:hypothetical protein
MKLSLRRVSSSLTSAERKSSGASFSAWALEQARLDGLGHAGQAQGGEGAGDFDEIHVSVSPG